VPSYFQAIHNSGKKPDMQYHMIRVSIKYQSL